MKHLIVILLIVSYSYCQPQPQFTLFALGDGYAARGMHYVKSEMPDFYSTTYNLANDNYAISDLAPQAESLAELIRSKSGNSNVQVWLSGGAQDVFRNMISFAVENKISTTDFIYNNVPLVEKHFTIVLDALLGASDKVKVFSCGYDHFLLNSLQPLHTMELLTEAGRNQMDLDKIMMALNEFLSRLSTEPKYQGRFKYIPVQGTLKSDSADEADEKFYSDFLYPSGPSAGSLLTIPDTQMGMKKVVNKIMNNYLRGELGVYD